MHREDDGALPMFMKAADLRYCRSAFERFDKDNSGTIDTKVRDDESAAQQIRNVARMRVIHPWAQDHPLSFSPLFCSDSATPSPLIGALCPLGTHPINTVAPIANRERHPRGEV